jgi:hypothetical protein
VAASAVAADSAAGEQAEDDLSPEHRRLILCHFPGGIALKILERDEIVKAVVEAVQPLPGAHAMWEGGAAAFGRLDAWSDIDLNVVADDGLSDLVFSAVEKALVSLSPFEKLTPIGSQDGYMHAFYRLERASPFHLVDLAVFRMTAEDKFLAPQVHGATRFFFNKGGKIEVTDVDREAFMAQVRARLERLAMRHRFFNNFVEKEISRGNWLEAMDCYQNITLSTLVELLRIRHYPYHHQFKMHYVHRELPPEILGRLQPLFFMKDASDLKTKYAEATAWIEEILSSGASPRP